LPRDIVLYVLKLQDGCYYVGQSANVHRRIDIHMEAGGAAWTRAHPPIDLVECNRTQTLDYKAAETKENLLTLEMMKRYGWRNVRGGWFCNVDETLTEKALKAHGLFDLMKSFENERSGSSKGSWEQPDICADYQPTVNSPPLKKVTISSVGSCDTATRLGFYEALMECNGKRKYLRRDLTDTTANRCIIQGLIDGVSNLKEPCEVILVASTSLGLAALPKLKGPNVDLLQKLVSSLQESRSPFTFEVVAGHGDELRQRIRLGEKT
jgi:predicted GIY-YIG superfamily endonuclease